MKSRHFTVDEFRCRDGTDYPAEWIDDRLAALCQVLDEIRDALQAPLIVVDGYRTAKHNALLASKSESVAKNSQHIQGRAADVRPANPTVANVALLHALTKGLYADGRIQQLGGLGYYRGLWIHVDVRAKVGGHLATWIGTGVGSEQ
jgi:uncharacterized protein YcbK (DUF882 family)